MHWTLGTGIWPHTHRRWEWPWNPSRHGIVSGYMRLAYWVPRAKVAPASLVGRAGPDEGAARELEASWGTRGGTRCAGSVSARERRMDATAERPQTRLVVATSRRRGGNWTLGGCILEQAWPESPPAHPPSLPSPIKARPAAVTTLGSLAASPSFFFPARLASAASSRPLGPKPLASAKHHGRECFWPQPDSSRVGPWPASPPSPAAPCPRRHMGSPRPRRASHRPRPAPSWTRASCCRGRTPLPKTTPTSATGPSGATL